MDINRRVILNMNGVRKHKIQTHFTMSDNLIPRTVVLKRMLSIWRSDFYDLKALKLYFYCHICLHCNRLLTATLELVLSSFAVFLHVAQQVGRYALAVRAPEHARAACSRRHRNAGRRFSHCDKKNIHTHNELETNIQRR